MQFVLCPAARGLATAPTNSGTVPHDQAHARVNNEAKAEGCCFKPVGSQYEERQITPGSSGNVGCEIEGRLDAASCHPRFSSPVKGRSHDRENSSGSIPAWRRMLRSVPTVTSR